MNMSEIRFVNPKDREVWLNMWGTLERSQLGGDRDCRCPETGEIWQYMGTIRYGRDWLHEFRHRHHPTTKQREIFRTKANVRFSEQRITDSFLDILVINDYRT